LGEEEGDEAADACAEDGGDDHDVALLSEDFVGEVGVGEDGGGGVDVVAGVAPSGGERLDHDVDAEERADQREGHGLELGGDGEGGEDVGGGADGGDDERPP
jgi:hypothetical protein